MQVKACYKVKGGEMAHGGWCLLIQTIVSVLWRYANLTWEIGHCCVFLEQADEMWHRVLTNTSNLSNHHLILLTHVRLTIREHFWLSNNDVEVPWEIEDLGHTEGVLITSCLVMKPWTSIKITYLLILTHSLEGGDIAHLFTIVTPVIATVCYTQCFLNRCLLNKYTREENISVK